MKAIELIRYAMQMTDAATARIVGDMRDACLTQSTPGSQGGGNHPLWILGHLAWVEGSIPQILFGETNPVGHWQPLFGIGSQPTTSANAYPPFDEVLAAYRDLRARNLKLLEQIGGEGLDRAPKNVPPGFEEIMQTIGRTFLTIALHNMVHYGQIADARRVAGRKPLL